MANRSSCCTLTRLVSFEEPEVRLQPVNVAGGPSAAPSATERRAVLQAYLQQLGSAGVVELPAAFGNLVAAEVADQRRACTASRGWLAQEAAPPNAQPAVTGISGISTAPVPVACTGAVSPKLREALKKVQQLDGALQAVVQRAAVVAARGRELEQAMRDAGVADENGGAGEEEGPAAASAVARGLEGAMRCERRRLQQADRLRDALEEGPAWRQVPDMVQDSGSTGGLTPEQERLVEALLGQNPAAAEADSASLSAAQDSNPFSPVAELAAIDARLAELAAGSEGQERAGWAAAAAAPARCQDKAAVVLAAAPLDSTSADVDDLAELKINYLRALAEAREVTHRLADIDVALASLRVCGGLMSSH